MKYNGVPMDKALMGEKLSEANEKRGKLREDIAFMVGNVDIGENAGTSALKKYFYKSLGLPVLKMTAGGQASLDDEALMLLEEWCGEHKPEFTPLFTMIQEYRKMSKLKSTYIEGYLNFINNATGRIHPDLLPLATETGRFAASNPNLQNCPRKDNDPVGVRNFIVAPTGKILLSLDFSQIELRVGAFYCRDEKMLDVYKTGGDIHAQTTAVVYKIPIEQAADKNAASYKERRVIAKNCNFGTFYGLFPNGLHRMLKFKAGLDTPIEECERIIENLTAGYPKLKKWQEQTKKTARFRHYTQTRLGRRRYLPDINSRDWGKASFAERCALNTPIQGTAADILKLALRRIIAGLPKRPWLTPILQIHDELVFEVPEEKLSEAAAFVKQCMEEQPFDGFDVPMVAEASAGRRFGEMKELGD
jgi:DNA polymerase-1